MQVNLTPRQLEEIIEALEKNPKEIVDRFDTLHYLKIVKQMSTDCLQPELDDIPF